MDEVLRRLRPLPHAKDPMAQSPPAVRARRWIDQIVRIGKTVAYGSHGPQGLLGNRRVVVITARGGAYEKDTLRERFDFQEPYLCHIFGFVGLTDVTFIHAENQLRDGARPSLEAAAERFGHLAA
jgi:FMN-dependent NADH-azoreductase